MGQFLDYLSAHPWILWLAFGLLSLVLSKRSQVDAWAEAHPRVAGVLKLLRSVGLDPWMLLQSLSLLIRGRLPDPPQPKATSKRPPPLVLLVLSVGLLSCADMTAQQRAETAVEIVTKAKQACGIYTLFPETPRHQVLDETCPLLLATTIKAPPAPEPVSSGGVDAGPPSVAASSSAVPEAPAP